MEKQDRYINPLTDFGFKKLFGTELNKDLLIDFLNELLPNKEIESLYYSTNEHFGKLAIDRKAIFDIYCVGKNGERFIVEMQKAKQNYFKDRSVFYSSFPIQEQAKRGDWNYKLAPVYSVGILDFKFDEHKEDDNFYHVVELKDQNCEVFYDKLKYIYIELPKFKKEGKELRSGLDKWLYVFTHLQNLQDRPKELQDRIFEKLFKVAEIAKFTKEEVKEYEESLKTYRDIKNVVDTAKEEGKEEGREEGKSERSMEIGKKLKSRGLSIEDIADITGLPVEEIEKL